MEDDRLVRSEHLSTGNSEDGGISDVSGSSGDSNSDRGEHIFSAQIFGEFGG